MLQVFIVASENQNDKYKINIVKIISICFRDFKMFFAKIL